MFLSSIVLSFKYLQIRLLTSLLITLLGGSASYADLLLSGNVSFEENGNPVAVPMEAEVAKEFFSYRWKAQGDSIDILDAQPVGVRHLTPFDEHSLFYKLRFREDDELVRVRLEFKHYQFKGSQEKDLPRTGKDNLHLIVDKSDLAFQNALKYAEYTLASLDNGQEISDAFDILVAEIRNGAEFSYMGSRKLAELIEHFAHTTPNGELPPRFSRFIFAVDNHLPISEFSDRRQFAIYRMLAEAVTKNYNVLQPLGGGNHVHDAARFMLERALEIAYRYEHEDPEAPIKRSLVANVAFERVKLDCHKVRNADICLLSLGKYTAWSDNTLPPKDIVSFFSTAGTALEHVSGIPNTDTTRPILVGRLRDDSYLSELWRAYHCLLDPHIKVLELSIKNPKIDEETKRGIPYVKDTLFGVASDVAKGYNCNEA